MQKYLRGSDKDLPVCETSFGNQNYNFWQIDLFCFDGFECAAGAAERSRTYYSIGRQIQIVALFLFHNKKIHQNDNQ